MSDHIDPTFSAALLTCAGVLVALALWWPSSSEPAAGGERLEARPAPAAARATATFGKSPAVYSLYDSRTYVPTVDAYARDLQRADEQQRQNAARWSKIKANYEPASYTMNNLSLMDTMLIQRGIVPQSHVLAARARLDDLRPVTYNVYTLAPHAPTGAGQPSTVQIVHQGSTTRQVPLGPIQRFFFPIQSPTTVRQSWTLPVPDAAASASSSSPQPQTLPVATSAPAMATPLPGSPAVTAPITHS